VGLAAGVANASVGATLILGMVALSALIAASLSVAMYQQTRQLWPRQAFESDLTWEAYERAYKRFLERERPGLAEIRSAAAELVMHAHLQRERAERNQAVFAVEEVAVLALEHLGHVHERAHQLTQLHPELAADIASAMMSAEETILTDFEGFARRIARERATHEE
jgi:hypothetical protein